MVAGGIALLGPLQANGRRDWVGGYIGPDIAIDEAHRGHGLGAELVLVRFLRKGGLPTWWLDEAPTARPAPRRTGLRGGWAPRGPISWRRSRHGWGCRDQSGPGPLRTKP